MHLKQVVEDLKTNLDQFLRDAVKNSEAGIPTEENEWALQIKDVNDAAYGEDLDLSRVEIP